MNEKKITCIICPIGCTVTVRGEGETITSISGHTCKRGETYAKAEFIHPERILTSTVRVCGAQSPLIPVRSSKPVPKELLFDCMAEIRKLKVNAPVRRYDCLISNICGSGADLVATGEAEAAL